MSLLETLKSLEAAVQAAFGERLVYVQQPSMAYLQEWNERNALDLSHESLIFYHWLGQFDRALIDVERQSFWCPLFDFFNTGADDIPELHNIHEKELGPLVCVRIVDYGGDGDAIGFPRAGAAGPVFYCSLGDEEVPLFETVEKFALFLIDAFELGIAERPLPEARGGLLYFEPLIPLARARNPSIEFWRTVQGYWTWASSEERSTIG